jgi:hypothetical protein
MRPLGKHLTRAATSTPEPVPWPVRWAFYLFIFSLPFEYPDRTIPVETTTLTAALLIGTAMLWPTRCLRAPPLAVVVRGVRVCLLGRRRVGGGYFATDAIRATIILLQLVLVVTIIANIMQEQQLTDRALLIFATACVLLAAMTLLGIGTRAGVDPDTEMVRMTVFGQNPNRAARILGGGVLVLVGLAYGRARALVRPPWLVWPFIAAIVLAVIHGGSRGGLLALGCGLMTYGVAGTTLKHKVRNAVVAVLVVGLVTAFAARSPLMQQRVALASEGNLAKREQIIPNALRMVLDRPLLGWGAENEYELQRRMLVIPGQSRHAQPCAARIDDRGAAGRAAVLRCSLACRSRRLARSPRSAGRRAGSLIALRRKLSGSFIAKLVGRAWLAFASGALAAQAPLVVPGAIRRAASRGRPSPNPLTRST